MILRAAAKELILFSLPFTPLLGENLSHTLRQIDVKSTNVFACKYALTFSCEHLMGPLHRSAVERQTPSFVTAYAHLQFETTLLF